MANPRHRAASADRTFEVIVVSVILLCLSFFALGVASGIVTHR